MKHKLVIFVIILILAVTARDAFARRENPFKAQLPVPVIEKPPVTENPDNQQQTVQEPEPEPVKDPEPQRVFLPPPPPPPEKPRPAVVRPPNMQIKGVIWNSNRPQAIINDQIIDIGDEISNAVITDIQKEFITFEYQGASFTTKFQ